MKKVKKDFVKEYKKKKIIWNLGIIALSLVLALWINFFVIDWTDIWKNLKASILDVDNQESKADFYIESSWNILTIKNSKQMQNPVSISLSLTYNPEILEIDTITTIQWELVNLWEKNTWSDTIIINTTWNDINANSTIIEIQTTKKEQTSTQLNMLNANFQDSSWNQYNLSTSGITF